MKGRKEKVERRSKKITNNTQTSVTQKYDREYVRHDIINSKRYARTQFFWFLVHRFVFILYRARRANHGKRRTWLGRRRRWRRQPSESGKMQQHCPRHYLHEIIYPLACHALDLPQHSLHWQLTNEHREWYKVVWKQRREISCLVLSGPAVGAESIYTFEVASVRATKKKWSISYSRRHCRSHLSFARKARTKIAHRIAEKNERKKKSTFSVAIFCSVRFFFSSSILFLLEHGTELCVSLCTRLDTYKTARPIIPASWR